MSKMAYGNNEIRFNIVIARSHGKNSSFAGLHGSKNIPSVLATPCKRKTGSDYLKLMDNSKHMPETAQLYVPSAIVQYLSTMSCFFVLFSSRPKIHYQDAKPKLKMKEKNPIT